MQNTINNPDIKIKISELLKMKQSGEVDLDKIGNFLEQNFDLPNTKKEVTARWNK